MSTKNAWYFDHGFWGNTKYYTWCVTEINKPNETFTKQFNLFRKTAYDNRLPKHINVLGGEACVWTELIDKNNLGLLKKDLFIRSAATHY